MTKASLLRKLSMRKLKLASNIYNVQEDTNKTISIIEKEINYIQKANFRLLRKSAFRKMILKSNSPKLEYSEEYMDYLTLMKSLLNRINENKVYGLISDIDDYKSANTVAINTILDM